MTRRLLAVDRVVSALVGLGLLLLGLYLLDWRFGVVGSYADEVRTDVPADVAASAWWPWVFAVAGVLLGLLGLYWLLAHLRRPGPANRRLSGSDGTGRLEADLRSVADALATRLESTAPVSGARGTTRSVGARTLLEIRASVERSADARELVAATEALEAEVAAAFPTDQVTCRVVIDAPRRRRLARNPSGVRVS